MSPRSNQTLTELQLQRRVIRLVDTGKTLSISQVVPPLIVLVIQIVTGKPHGVLQPKPKLRNRPTSDSISHDIRQLECLLNVGTKRLK